MQLSKFIATVLTIAIGVSSNIAIAKSKEISKPKRSHTACKVVAAYLAYKYITRDKSEDKSKELKNANMPIDSYDNDEECEDDECEEE
ncbi:MAG: hypothetical protein Q4A81_04710 [Pasteurellaceae bacterium]|nr:hypothetical protein [Pasteurellaceae bacterium]